MTLDFSLRFLIVLGSILERFELPNGGFELPNDGLELPRAEVKRNASPTMAALLKATSK